ncbi:MAG: hypothetical protein K2H64_07270, partial [Desulfovibrio sp.]|nr:hypothetical protein [Desulfovibrio sp.]
MLKFTEIKPVGELGKLIFDSLNDETLDIFWDKRRDQMLECAFKYDFIDGLPGLKDDAKRAIANSRKCGRMSANLIISLRQKIKDLNPVYRNQWTRQMGLPIIAEFVNKYDTLPGWQILLAASTLSSIPGFPKEAAVFPEELKAALADADREKETLEKFAPFAPFARAIAGFVYIPLQRESALKEYGQKISSADYNSWDTPEQIRAYEKNVIKPWLELRRNAKFAARKLRNILSAMPEGVVVLEGKEPEDLPILVGDRKFCAGVVGRLIKAMEATLPPVFSLDDTLAGLAAIEPPLSEKDMTRARAEAEKIAAGELAPGASWLMAWILPVIRGEAAGDMERMEALEDSLGDWPYSLKLSNGLLQNRYKLAPEQAGNAVASSPEASAKDAAGGKPPASSETRVVAEDKSSVSPEADVVAENRPAPANGTGRDRARMRPPAGRAAARKTRTYR